MQQQLAGIRAWSLTSDAKESVGASVPDVSTTQRALSVSSLKATAGFRDHRHSCTTKPDSVLSSSSSMFLETPCQSLLWGLDQMAVRLTDLKAA